MDFKKDLEASRRWAREEFSNIPVELLKRAYGDWAEDIEIVAPTFDDWWEENKDDYEGEMEGLEAYEEMYPKYPMWGWAFVPDDASDEEWIGLHADEIAELGFIVYWAKEIGHYLGIDGAGYDFYTSHWLPLYRLRFKS